MSKARPPADPSAEAPARRVNPTALIVLAVVALVALPGFYLLQGFQARAKGPAYLQQAKARIEAKDPGLALNYLKRYLDLNPDDEAARQLQAEVLAGVGRDDEGANQQAVASYNYLLARHTDDPKGQELRRLLIDLNLRSRNLGVTIRAAEALARDLIRRGADDAPAHRQLARALQVLGNSSNDTKMLDQAVREYETAEAKEPGDVESAERLAFLYRTRFNNPDRATRVLDALLRYNAASPRKVAATRLARCRHFMALGRREEAIKEAEQAIGAVPGDLDARLILAETSAQGGDTAGAREHLKSIEEASRSDLRIKLVGGLIDLNERRPDEAVQSWREGLLQTGGADEELTWRLAQVLLQLGRVREAEPLLNQYRRLVGGDEPTPEYRYLVALAMVKSGRFAEAIAEMEAIRYKINKTLDSQLNFLMGQAYEQNRDPTKALASYRQAGELARRWNAPWLAIARLEGQAHPDLAIAALQRGLADTPDDPSLLANLAQAMWRAQMQQPAERRDWSAFEAVVERGKRTSPGAVDLVLVQADYLNAVGKPEDAQALLAAASKQSPDAVGIWLARANLLYRRGQADAALEVLDRATAAAGEHTPLATTRAFLLIAKGRIKAARFALVDAVDRVPVDERPAIWKALGEFYQNQNDAANARRAYSEWSRLRPEDPEPRLVLVDLDIAAGDEKALHSEVEGLKGLGGPKAQFWRVARVSELLRDRPGASPQEAAVGPNVEEAANLISELKAENPNLPTGFLLEGRLAERQNRVDDAVRAYTRAIDLRGGSMAIQALVVLLTREHRDAELDKLRGRSALSPEMERLSAEVTLKMGDRDRAEQMVKRLVQGDPQSLDLRAWEARVLNGMGKPEEAERSIRSVLEQRPDDPSPWVQLMMSQLAQKKLADAAATVEKMRARVRTDLPELLWAMCYQALGDGPKAEAAYGDALRRWPDDVRVRMAAIAFYESTGRIGEAEASLRHLLKKDSSLSWAVRKLALILAERNRDLPSWQEALKLVGDSATGADSPDDRLVRAVVYARGPEPRHRREAISILLGLAAELPNNAAIHLQLARMLLADGQAAKGREHAARAAAAEDATPEALLVYAGMLMVEKDYAAAEGISTRLQALAPDALPAVELRARLLANRGKVDEAASQLEAAFAAREKSPEALVVGRGIMRVLEELKKPEAAERVGRKVASTGPAGSLTLADFYSRSGRDDDAAALIMAVGKAGDPRDAGRAALGLASTHDADARWLGRADELLGLALKGEPDSLELLQAQAYLRHLQSRHDDELKLYDAVLARNPNNFLFLNNMGWTLSENLNRPEEGLRRVDEALEKLGFEPHVVDTRGVILTRLGRYDEAIKALESAAAVLPTGPVYYHLARANSRAGRADGLAKYRDLARKAKLEPSQLQPVEREEYPSIMTP